jgi:hypothetical protein
MLSLCFSNSSLCREDVCGVYIHIWHRLVVGAQLHFAAALPPGDKMLIYFEWRQHRPHNQSGQKTTNSLALSPQANYTDWTTATCRQNLVPTFVDRGVSRGQRSGSLMVVNLSFLDRPVWQHGQRKLLTLSELIFQPLGHPAHSQLLY